MIAKKTIGLFTAFTVFTLGASLAGTMAWFANAVTISNTKMNGSSEGTYFAYGDGTSGSPYGIRTPRQLYNLAWMQYAGNFNKNSNNVLEKQYYFEIDPTLSEPLDMSGWVLPPIGTETYPFLGNFNGNNKIINNLTISNKSVLSKPASITYNVQPEIVGLFGVVGKLNNVPAYSYATATNAVTNVTLRNLTVESKTSKTLIGLAGGYVNADMSGVKIDGAATIDVNGQTSTARTDITNRLSDYSLVGYTTKTGASGSYSQKLSQYFNNGGGPGEGQGDDWGGSINMRALNERLYTLLTTNKLVKNPTANEAYTTGRGVVTGYNNSNRYHRYYADDYNYVTVYNGTNASTYFDSSPLSNTIVYALEGISQIRASTSQNTYTTRPLFYVPETILPLLVDKNNDTLSKNTGYIVAGDGGTSTDTYPNRQTIRCSSYYIDRIENSYSTSDPSSTTIYTNAGTSYANGFTTIDDEDNEFEKYAASKKVLMGILEDQTLIQGLHFTGGSVSTSNPKTISKAYINNNEYNNYQLPQSCIDFNLKEEGFINFFAGSYRATSNDTLEADSFFSLNVVQRSGSNLSSIKEISKIYENTKDETKEEYPYVYQYTDNTYSTGTAEVSYTTGSVVFDMQYLWETPPTHKALYYFEIPVNAGEYAMGAHSGKTNGAYMLYLDIGASNKTKDGVTAYSITTKTGGNSYPLGIDFIPIAVSGNGGDTISTSIASGNKGVLVFVITTSDIAVTDSSSISQYAYRSDKYVASSPTSNQYTCNLSGAPPNIASGGTRVLNIHLTKTDDTIYDIRITDVLSDDAGTISSSTYELSTNGGAFANSDYSTITSLSTEININSSTSDTDSLRNLEPVVTLTRNSGNGEFITTYDTSNCTDTKIDVDIELNGTTVSVGTITTGYTFYVSGAQKYATNVIN